MLPLISPNGDSGASGSDHVPVAPSPVSPASSVVSIEQRFRRSSAKAAQYSPLSQDSFCRSSPLATPGLDSDSEIKASGAHSHVKRKLMLQDGGAEAIHSPDIMNSIRIHVIAAGAQPRSEAIRHVSWPCLPCTLRSARRRQNPNKKGEESSLTCVSVGSCFRCQGNHGRIACPVYPRFQAPSSPRVSSSHVVCVVCGLPSQYHVNLQGNPVRYGGACTSFAKDYVLAGCWSMFRSSELLHSPAAKCVTEIEFRDWLLVTANPNSTIPNCVTLVHWALSDLYHLL